MGLIYKPITLIGTVGTKTFKALMDTGASRCYIRSNEASLIAQPSKIPTVTLKLGKGEIQVNEILDSLVELDGYRLPWSFIVVPSLTEELIIGADFFQLLKIKLNPETEEIIIDPSALKIQLI
ncbi:MAG: retropepsin-like domain-containing protein [candidate division KSB1 bacterium]|nr:retropepsin-like domain-containing protein [candidate division KSB1 bacterium]